MELHEKIMAGLLALAVTGFFIAPCCWHSASKMSDKKFISCPGNAIPAHDELKQKKKIEREISKAEIRKAF